MIAATRRTICKSRRDRKRSSGSFPRRGLTSAQEEVAVVLRRSLLLSLDDLLSVVREFLNPDVSRSGLDRCLRRHGVANLKALVAQTPRPTHKPFKGSSVRKSIRGIGFSEERAGLSACRCEVSASNG